MGDFDEMRRLVNILLPNTFIGGIGDSANTPDASTLASKLNISASDIKNFQIDSNNNVSCFIDADYEIDGFSTYYQNGGGVFNFWIDTTGRCAGLSGRSISGANLKILTPNATSWGSQSTRKGSVDFAFCPKIINGTSFPFYDWRHGINRLYIPRLVNLDTTYAFVNFSLYSNDSKKVIYVNPSLATSDGGNVHPRINYIISRGADVRYVTNFTPPSNITNLSAGAISATSAVLNFTSPSSTNTLDFYEVWLDDGTNNPAQIFLPSKEITTAGATITGLKSGTTYKIKIAACDIYWNGSGMSENPSFSNEITITTL